MFALCRECRRALQCYETPPMLGEVEWPHMIFPASRVWVHVVKPVKEHTPVPLPGILDRVLLCADCRQPQVYHHRHGWECGNEHCTGVDKA